MTEYRTSDGLPVPSKWLRDRIADALSSDVGRMAVENLYETGESRVAVNYTFSRNSTPEEDYTCDKCRWYHPSGLNVAVFAIGKGADEAYATIKSPLDMLDWAVLIVNVGLCHTCWASEGYPPNALSVLDDRHVSQAVRLLEVPPREVLA